MMHVQAASRTKQFLASVKTHEKYNSPLENLNKLLQEAGINEAIQVAEGLDCQHEFIPNRILLGLLDRCTTSKDLEAGKRVHKLMVSNGLGSISFFCDHLIRFYGACEDLREANHVFYEAVKPSIYTWNAIISVHVKLGKCERALSLYQKMQQKGTKPEKVTYLFLLKACGSIQDSWYGRCIHNQIVQNGLHTNIVVGSTLVDMYCKCGDLVDARKVFDGLPHCNTVSWGVMISGYVQSGEAFLALELFEIMQQQNTKPDGHTFSCVLKACGVERACQLGMIIHDKLIKDGLHVDVVIENTLVDMYAKCGALEEAHKVFGVSPRRNAVSWGALISGYVQHGQCLHALDLFRRLQQVQDVKPSKATFSCALKACGMVKCIDQGMLIHAFIVNELQFDVVVANALIDMYVKCSKLNDAYSVFNLSPQKNTVSWGTMISGYVQQGNGLAALALFEEMKEQDSVPDEVLTTCILKACTIVRSAGVSLKMHDQIVRNYSNMSEEVHKALVNMYINCALLVEAQNVFDRVTNKDVVLWSVMIDGFVQHGHSLMALMLFMKMQEVSTKPDKFIFSCILKACRIIGALGHGRWIHNQVVTNGLETDMVVGGALIDMYTCCESLSEAYRIFARLPIQNEVSWGAIIAGYAQSGNYTRVQQFLGSMQEQGLKPNDVIMTSVLATCSHAGLLEEGFCHFEFMQKLHGYMSSITNYSCLVDLLGRAGCFKQASDLMETMPMRPDGFSWAALFTGCRTYSNIECATDCFDGYVELNPREAAGYVMMSSVVASDHLGDGADDKRGFSQMMLEAT